MTLEKQRIISKIQNLFKSMDSIVDPNFKDLDEDEQLNLIDQEKRASHK